MALSVIQPKGELQGFWLQTIQADSHSERVITSVHGLLSGYDKQEERREQIPESMVLQWIL